MPINLFNDPLASLKLGADNILKGYIGNDRIFPNSLTLTIVFVDNTSANVNLDNASTVSFTGSPGANWSSFNRTLTRVNGTVRITGATGSENGDTQNILSIVESGTGSVARSLTFSGTLPTVSQTITVTITDTFVNLQTRTLYVGPGATNIPRYSTIGRVGWSGGGNGTVYVTSNYDAGYIYSTAASGGGGFPNGLVWGGGTPINTPITWYGNAAQSIPNYLLGANVSPGSSYSFMLDINQTGGTVIPKISTLTVSVEENNTYQAQSASASYSRNA